VIFGIHIKNGHAKHLVEHLRTFKGKFATQFRFTNDSLFSYEKVALAASGPEYSVPAIGCEATKFLRRG
jgi:hypothetical protein